MIPDATPRRPAGRRRRDPERGAAAVAAYLFMVVMLGFLALSLNTGILMETRTELQMGSDSASLAAAGSLDGTVAGTDRARAVAAAYTQEHQAFDETIRINPADDVKFGHWHLRLENCTYGAGNDCFQEMAVSPATAPRINAVRVDNGRDGDENSVLDLPFGTFVGRNTATVTSGSVAIGAGVGRPDCALPLVVSQCALAAISCGAEDSLLDFSNSNEDEVGYVNFDFPSDSQSPSDQFVSQYMLAGRVCSDRPSAGLSKLQNGNDFKKVGQVLRGELGNTCYVGTTQTLAVTDSGCSDGNAKFNGPDTYIVGFVQADIVAVVGNDEVARGCGDATFDLGRPLEKNSIIMRIRCESPAGSPGAINFGLGPNRVRIVK